MNRPISKFITNGWRRSLALWGVCWSLVATAQTSVEFFWDVDPGFGKGIQKGYTAQGNTTEVAFDLSTTALTAGVHQLGFRTITPQSDGTLRFSPTYFTYVVKDAVPQHTQIEYFWGDDPGVGKGHKYAYTATADTCDVQFQINTAALPEGLHRLGLRTFTTAEGREYASPTLWHYVVKPTKVYADHVEYFWDADPGFGKGTFTPITTSDDPTDVSFNVSVDGLSKGLHRLCFRSFTKGGWSPTVQYYVRILNGEPQPITAIEYFWDTDPGYGKGMPVAFTPATTVDLTGYEFDTSGLTGDHVLYIRAKGKGGWSPVVMQKIACTAEGAYTLNDLAAGTERNFQTLHEMFTEFKVRNVSGDITATVRSGATFNFDATTADALAMLAEVTEDLRKNHASITFTAISAATLAITTNEADVATVLALCANVRLEHVTLLVNGTAYDFSMLTAEEEELCHGSQTEARPWSTMATGVTVNWKATATRNAFVKGYVAEGTGDLPSMTLTNMGSARDYVTYAVTLRHGETEIHSFTYTIYVQPTVASKSVNFTNATPKDASVVNPGTVTIAWSKVGGATVYEVTVTRTADADGTLTTETTEQTATTITIQAETGYSYLYKVRAIGPCDITAEYGRSFTTFRASANDRAALKTLYDACDGKTWSKQWNFDAEVLASTNYPGVTFNAAGHVTVIDLVNAGIKGELPKTVIELPNLESLNLSRNSLVGNVPAVLFSKCPSLKTLNLSYNQLTAVEDVLPAHITSLDLSSQHRVYKSNNLNGIEALGQENLDLQLAMEDAFRLNSLLRYNHQAQDWSYVPSFYLYDQALSAAHPFATLNYSNGYYHLTFANSEYHLAQDAELILVATNGSAKNAVQPVVVSYVEADANVDRLVDVLDVQHSLNYVVAENGAEGLFNWSAANTFEDDVINIQDIVVTVNHVLEHTNTVAQSRARRMTAAERTKAHGRLYVADGNLYLSADTAVAALDIELQGATEQQVRLMLATADWQMRTRTTETGIRLVIFSPTGKTLPTGTTRLLALRADAHPIAAEAASAEARALTIGVEDGSVTGLDAVEQSETINAHIVEGALHVTSNMDCEDITLHLYDIAGRQIVKLTNVTLQTGDNTWSIGTSKQGIYLLQIGAANGTTHVIRIVAK